MANNTWGTRFESIEEVTKIEEGANGYTGKGLSGMFLGMEKTFAEVYLIGRLL